MLVKMAYVGEKLADVEPKMAVVLAEVIPPKNESGRYKIFLKLMTRILVGQSLRKLEMPDYARGPFLVQKSV